MSHVVFPILWALAMVVFVAILASRARMLLAAAPASRFDHVLARIRRMTVDGLGQRKFLSGEQPAGIMHALVFWGFVVLMLQVITLFGRAFDANWNIPGFGPDQLLGPPFFIVRDLLEVTVIVGAGYMLYRRVIVHPSRLVGIGSRGAALPRRGSPRGDPDPRVHRADHDRRPLVRRGAPRRVQHPRQRARLRAADGARRGCAGGLSHSTAQTLSEVGWWIHCVTILIFLNLLPLSKHFHIITAIPNVFLSKLPPRGIERPLAITQAPAAGVGALEKPAEGAVGVASLLDLSWKQVLDSFTCTECGRCSAVCPATASGTPLAPRQLILDIRDALYHHERRQWQTALPGS